VDVTNNTPIYWEAWTQSLHTYAWSISTKAGSHHSAAPKRGDDVVIPFQPGHQYADKTRDSHFPSLPMWIEGKNQDGSIDNTMTLEAKLTANYNYLMSLMNVDGQFPLTKRWYEGTTIKSAVAQAELLDPPEIDTNDRSLWKLVWDLKLADPYYYDAEISQAIGTINVEGYARTSHVVIEMGAGTVTFPDGNFLTYTGTGTAIIDCHTGMAKVGSNFVNGQVERNRHFPQFPQLVPGSNVITGSGTIRYEPAYW
jgi:hypothetical protein